MIASLFPARLKHSCVEFTPSPPLNFPAASCVHAAKAKAVAEREAAEAAVFRFRAKDVPDRIRESKSIDFEAEEREREAERARRIKEAAVSKCAAAALPPRMQARAQQEKEGGGGHKAVAAEHSFAPEINGVVPDFASRHARSQAQLEAVKAKLAAEKKAIVVKAFELRSDRVYWSKIAQFEGFYAGASVDEGCAAALGALGLEMGCSQWALLCALRSKVGGRDFLMREVFEEFCVMPPGNLQVLADAERDKVSRESRSAQSCCPVPLCSDPPFFRPQVTGKEMRWPYCARSEERHGLTSVITPRAGSGDVGPPPQPVNPERTPVKKVSVMRLGVVWCKMVTMLIAGWYHAHDGTASEAGGGSEGGGRGAGGERAGGNGEAEGPVAPQQRAAPAVEGADAAAAAGQ